MIEQVKGTEYWFSKYCLETPSLSGDLQGKTIFITTLSCVFFTFVLSQVNCGLFQKLRVMTSSLSQLMEYNK